MCCAGIFFYGIRVLWILPYKINILLHFNKVDVLLKCCYRNFQQYLIKYPGTEYPSVAPVLTPDFQWGSCCLIFCLFGISLFTFCRFSFGSFVLSVLLLLAVLCCLSFFFWQFCVVCPSSISGFWLPLWYLFFHIVGKYIIYLYLLWKQVEKRTFHNYTDSNN